MGNEQGKTASPAEVRVPHVLKAQSQGDDEIDASRVRPSRRPRPIALPLAFSPS